MSGAIYIHSLTCPDSMPYFTFTGHLVVSLPLPPIYVRVSYQQRPEVERITYILFWINSICAGCLYRVFT